MIATPVCAASRNANIFTILYSLYVILYPYGNNFTTNHGKGKTSLFRISALSKKEGTWKNY